MCSSEHGQMGLISESFLQNQERVSKSANAYNKLRLRVEIRCYARHRCQTRLVSGVAIKSINRVKN